MKRPTMLRLAAAPALAASLALGGCGSGDATTASTTAATTAVSSGSSSAPAGTSAPASTSATTSAAAPATTSAAASGAVIDPKAFSEQVARGAEKTKTYHMTMSSKVGGQTLTGEGDADLNGQGKLAMTMSVGPTKMVMKFVDGNAYMQAAGITPAGKFVKMSEADLAKQGTGSLSDQLSIEKQQAQFTKGLQKVVDGGEEKVGGEDLHRYDLTVDTKTMMSSQTDPSLTTMTEKMPKQIPYTVWLDDEDRMRAMKMTIPSMMAMETTISKIGEPVTITAPAASEIATM